MSPRAAVLLAVAVLAAGCTADDPGGTSAASSPVPSAPAASSTASAPPPTAPAAPVQPLAGHVVVLDPGHQLGNARFPSQVNRRVDAGGFDKACNTTGTSTDDGYPEATFTWQVAVEVRRRLRALGARVVLTRDDNSADDWGPCIDERGRVGNPGEPGPTADVRISLHADGNRSSTAHGFHVIRPGERAGWTDDVVAPSERLAVALRDALVGAGFTPSTYLGEDGIDVRTDLGTLNHSDVPVVMVELGNMRDDRDASVMESDAGRRRYARAVVTAVRGFLGV
ncbi:N-acetylmuramoyl-L-alanine amidase [Nocardioides sp. QY071]|uniref:N-acetylmuramoyl-L-alanine amidase family protein n=1 Tax=Nocardioides sp. QY071 TaxID=3044187 RepID=UPI00249A6BC0|nr:N-acetylmuramoyl-L-alanine amidase [Nocardioides sp. QY071]WGY01232.1 N-acetylmuramoyl-L-alanine amidase [Nocardioides sp. QY071]